MGRGDDWGEGLRDRLATFGLGRGARLLSTGARDRPCTATHLAIVLVEGSLRPSPQPPPLPHAELAPEENNLASGLRPAGDTVHVIPSERSESRDLERWECLDSLRSLDSARDDKGRTADPTPCCSPSERPRSPGRTLPPGHGRCGGRGGRGLRRDVSKRAALHREGRARSNSEWRHHR